MKREKDRDGEDGVREKKDRRVVESGYNGERRGEKKKKKRMIERKRTKTKRVKQLKRQ